MRLSEGERGIKINFQISELESCGKGSAVGWDNNGNYFNSLLCARHYCVFHEISFNIHNNPWDGTITLFYKWGKQDRQCYITCLMSHNYYMVTSRFWTLGSQGSRSSALDHCSVVLRTQVVPQVPPTVSGTESWESVLASIYSGGYDIIRHIYLVSALSSWQRAPKTL